MSQFAGLDFSDNEEEQPKVAPKKSNKDSKDAAAAKPKTESKAKTDSKPKDAAVSKSTNAAKPTKAPAAKSNDAPTANAEIEIAKDNNRGGRPRGKDSKRSEKRREGEEDGRKRTFDRRSGTGRGKEVSRGGRGPFGAGNVDQEAQEAEKNPAAAEVTVADEEAGVEEEKAEPEPAETTMTFDDFLRKREESRLNSSLLAPAKATRVVDVQAQFAGLTTKEDGEDTYIAGKNSKNVAGSKKDQRSTSKAQVLDVAFRFESSAPVERRRDNDSRGGRGGGKSRPQTNRRNTPASSFNGGDFPSL